MSKCRKFTAEFKRGVVEQASQPGVSCAQVARELEIAERGWQAAHVVKRDRLAELKALAR